MINLFLDVTVKLYAINFITDKIQEIKKIAIFNKKKRFRK